MTLHPFQPDKLTARTFENDPASLWVYHLFFWVYWVALFQGKSANHFCVPPKNIYLSAHLISYHFNPSVVDLIVLGCFNAKLYQARYNKPSQQDKVRSLLLFVVSCLLFVVCCLLFVGCCCCCCCCLLFVVCCCSTKSQMQVLSTTSHLTS